MNKLFKRSLSLAVSLTMGVSLLTGCFSTDSASSSTTAPSQTPAPTQSAQTAPTTSTEPSQTTTETAYAPDYSKSVELNMSVFYNNTVYMRYTVDGGKNRPQSEYVAANGKTYREGDLKPVWEELSNRLNFTVNDVTPMDAKDINASFTTLQAQNFQGVDIMVANALKIVQEGVTNGTYLKLDEYMEYMPNFANFLAENSVVETTVTAGDGHIYYAPYFDGYDDIERMLMLRVDWVVKLLDDDSVTYDTNRTVNTYYEPYMPETLSTTLTVANSAGTGTQSVKKEYSQNIITVQNNLAVKDGANLVQALKDHIDSTYGDTFANRSDLFVGQDAAYDADELVALMRCVIANTELLTGQNEYDAVPLFQRKYQAGRYRDLFRFMGIWGVRGMDSRLEYLFLDENGELQDARIQEETMDALERMNWLYKEGLILKDFDKDESTSGLSGSDHRDRLLGANLGFMTVDYNQTTTVYNSYGEEGNDPYIDGFFFTPVLYPVADWDNNGNYYQFSEAWRSVKSDGWAILSSIASDEDKLMRAISLFDYMYSVEGNRLMSYGPEAWIDGEIMYNGEMVPKLSDAALTELSELAGNNYTNYYRMWLGATFPIGYVKQQGMEFQTVHEKGKVGLEYILNASNLGVLKHLVMNSADAPNPSYLTLPTTFATTQAEELFIKDNCGELSTNFKEGNNDNDRHMFVDYIMNGFGGTTATGSTLLDKQGLIDYINNDLNASGYLQVYRSAYLRMVD